MSDARGDTTQRDDMLIALLRRPDALFAAIASDGIRIAVPASLALAESRAIPVPADRVTMLDVVVPQDHMAVIAAWETVTSKGVTHAAVHARNEPDRRLTLTFVDARHMHGVLLAVLSDPGSDGVAVASSALEGSMMIPLRPRTATVHKNMLAAITAVDDRAIRMLGWNAEQLVGTKSIDFVHPEDQERAIASWLDMLSSKETMRVRLRQRCADGTWLWVEIENFYTPHDDPSQAFIIAEMSDISDEMAMHGALEGRERLLRRLAESLPIGLMQLATDRTLVYANARLSAILGVSQADTLDAFLAPVLEADRAGLDVALAGALLDGFDAELEVRVRLPLTGELRDCAVSLVSLSDREGAPGALVCLNDVTESARMREELKTKATYDALTGCHNRASITAILDDALRTSQDLLTAVVFVDIDKFKPVNDTMGHAAGDELLVHMASQLKTVLRHDDAVGRIGGDEFLLVSRGLESASAALALAERVRAALRRPMTLSAGAVEVSVSIGVACSEPGIDSDALTRRADQAMYESKQLGQGQPVLFGTTSLH